MDQGKPVLIAPDLHLKDPEQTRFGIILGPPSEGEDPSPPREAELTLELYSCGRLFAARPLSLTMRSGFGDTVKELLCGFSTNSAKDKDMGVQRSHSWEPVKMQAQPRQKVERDAAFTRQKAQRASFRAHLREKYNLPKNPADEKQLEAAGAKPQLPRDLLSIAQPNRAWPAPPNRPSFGGIDFDSLQASLRSPAQSFPRPGPCRLM